MSSLFEDDNKNPCSLNLADLEVCVEVFKLFCIILNSYHTVFGFIVNLCHD